MSWSFRALEERDWPLLHEWLNRPHVAWDDAPTLDEVRALYPVPPDGTLHYIAWFDGQPAGFVQVARQIDGHADGWSLDEHDPGAYGIDQFLADGARLGEGRGTAMVSAFVALLFADSRVTQVQVDPAPDNARAIRCYEKCGFVRARAITTPDGPALLMVRRR